MKVTIPIMNPPRTKRGAKKSRRGGIRMKTRRRKKRKASPKQLAALAKGRASRKAKLKSSKRRVKRGRRKPSVLVAKKARKVVRRRKASSRRLKNPFLGELAMIGNPKRRHKKSHKKSHRRSRRHSRGLTLGNPGKAMSAILAGPKEMVSMDFAKDAVSVAAGFVLPNMIVAKLPANLRDSRPKVYASKIAVVAGLSAASSMVSKRAAKMILLGGGVSILLDAWVDWIAPALGQGAPTPAAGTSVYYGNSDSGMSVYYGDSAGSLSESFGG